MNTLNALKRFLKRKISITQSLLVFFLITGGTSFSNTIEHDSFFLVGKYQFLKIQVNI
ncbi:MAG: hypothetical protein ACRC4T_23140 [Cetobacterium sp.]